MDCTNDDGHSDLIQTSSLIGLNQLSVLFYTHLRRCSEGLQCNYYPITLSASIFFQYCLVLPRITYCDEAVWT